MKNIELASIDQIDLIMKIIKACTRHMIDNGIFQWNDKYPTKQSFIDDINNNDLFVLKLENKIIGCVCASFDMDEFYKQIVWETSSKKIFICTDLQFTPTTKDKVLQNMLWIILKIMQKKMVVYL